MSEIEIDHKAKVFDDPEYCGEIENREECKFQDESI